ncbi:MAG: EamA family transporter RarD [Alphaproteobacteria bacterium]
MERERLLGGLWALAAFGFWGFIPVYIKAVAHVPAPELLAHRTIWSMLLLLVLIALGRRWSALRAGLAERRVWLLLAVSTSLLALNWLVFIWAINDGRVLEASLGYYINPLVNVLLGVLVLRERLNPWQGLAVAVATIGVLNLTLQLGNFPWVSLTLAASFGTYGLIRKTIRLNSLEGLFVETALVAPLGLAYLIYLGATGTGAFGAHDRTTDILLVLSGAVTALPLVAFASAVRRLQYSTVGFFQYIAPSGHFLLAVFVYDEAFTDAHLLTFALIWTALAIFTAQSLRAGRRKPSA